jgi:uncharacterized membrane protein YgcG
MTRVHARRRIASAAMAAVLLVGWAASPGAILAAISNVATSPSSEAQVVPRLEGAITDPAGVVGEGRAGLQRAIADLLTRENVQLYALFVGTTSGEDPATYAQAAFEQNALGGNDFLVLVAVDDRRFAWWEESAVPSLTSTEMDQLLARSAEDRFRAGDYAGGVAAFATALAEALGGTAEPTAQPTQTQSGGGTPPSGSGRDAGVAAVIVGLVLVLVGLMVIYAWWRNRRLSRLSLEERDRRTGQLARDANAVLLQADDAVREADQELGFAEAQFDEADVAPLRDAITRARSELKAAFAVRQQLDDAIPDDPAAKERMLGEILERSRGIVALLQEQTQRIQGLREQEQAAPQTLAALPARIATLEERLPTVGQALEQVHAYAATIWQPVEGNLAEAEKRLASAKDEVDRGTQALAGSAPQPAAAAASARRAERAIAEAATLLDGIDRLVATVEDAARRLEPELRAAERDVRAARDAAGAQPDPDLATRLAEAENLLAQARQRAASPAPDVIGALKDAQAANAAADAILAGIRDAAQQRARERQALESALRSAGANVARAGDFVATRRPGVGREARTRLAEAQRHLEAARTLASSEPARAVEEAAFADRLAADAYRLAESDFDDWDRRGSRRGDDLGTAILGGMILGNVLGGMGRRSGGWGGTPWGMPGGGGRGGRGSFGGLGGIIRSGRGGRGSW